MRQDFEIPEIPVLPKRVPWREDWPELNRHWWRRPQTVRILMYMDGQSFNGGAFQGLQHVINGVTSDPWPWAKFEITTANRFGDPSADEQNVTFTDLDLDTYDEVWLFGISSSSSLLTAAEVTALEVFMDAGGGVLTTGDHDNLGRGLSGPLKRVGELRMYPAPPSSAPVWNTTLRDGNGDGQYDFIEQSDALPQQIRPKYYYHWGWGWPYALGMKKSPHPLLCAEQGVLKTLPDHQHEGQVVIPTAFPVSDWPKNGSFQPKPEVVAWGRIVDPDAENTGTEFPVIGAYDGHRANVGRIVADSTWHHWFDINLVGLDTTSNEYRDIISYFQNVAAWLAPKRKQMGMRFGVFILALHENGIIEHDLRRVPMPLGISLVWDALGRWAPQCLVRAWVLELLPDRVVVRLTSINPKDVGARQPLEDVVLLEAFAELQERFKVRSGRLRAIEAPEAIDAALQAAGPRAAERLVSVAEADLRATLSLASPLTKQRGVTQRSPRKKPKRPKRKAGRKKAGRKKAKPKKAKRKAAKKP